MFNENQLWFKQNHVSLIPTPDLLIWIGLHPGELLNFPAITGHRDVHAATIQHLQNLLNDGHIKLVLQGGNGTTVFPGYDLTDAGQKAFNHYVDEYVNPRPMRVYDAGQGNGFFGGNFIVTSPDQIPLCVICGETPGSYCKKCRRRDNDYKRDYGITLEVYNQMLKKQNGQCAVCNNPPRGKFRLAVDHNHNLPKGHPKFVRGLLCGRCNRLLGHMGDSTETLSHHLTHLLACYDYLVGRDFPFKPSGDDQIQKINEAISTRRAEVLANILRVAVKQMLRTPMTAQELFTREEWATFMGHAIPAHVPWGPVKT